MWPACPYPCVQVSVLRQEVAEVGGFVSAVEEASFAIELLEAEVGVMECGCWIAWWWIQDPGIS